VILGGLFFQEFFGVFQNQYNQTTGSQQAQAAQLYIQISSSFPQSYIGNEMLPMGANPFIKPAPTPTPDKASVIWIIILCIIVVLLAGFLGWAIYKWRTAEKESEEKRNVLYNNEEKAPLASQSDLNASSDL